MEGLWVCEPLREAKRRDGIVEVEESGERFGRVGPAG